MTRINITKDLTLRGNTVSSIAIHKNPYLKNPDKILASVQYVNEVASGTTVSSDYSAELVKKLDLYTVKDGKDTIFGVSIEKTSDGKFQITELPEGNVYVAKFAKIDDEICELDQESLEWIPETTPVLEISPKIYNLKITVPAGTATTTVGKLYYPNHVFMSDTQSTTSSNYSNLTLFVETCYPQLLEKNFTTVPFITTLVLNESFFMGYDLENCSGTVVDLSSMTLTKIIVKDYPTQNIDSAELVKKIRKFMNLADTVEISFES